MEPGTFVIIKGRIEKTRWRKEVEFVVHGMELLQGLREKKAKNIEIKLPSSTVNKMLIQELQDVLMDNEVEAVIISNTSNATRENLKDIQKHQKGGLSGKPIEDKSNLLINKFYKHIKNKIKIIGVGGVDSGLSAYNKFLAGADYIQLYTGMVYKGPNIVNIIKNDLRKILIQEGVRNFTEIVGNKSKL